MAKPKDVEAYIAAAPDQARPILEELRTIVLTTIPNVEEKISWGVPFYRHHGEIGGFAHAKHVSVGRADARAPTAPQAKATILKDTFQIKFDQKVPRRDQADTQGEGEGK
jgi:uncharacterized protein YdhG (YjbR/CyaY superfamily)